MTVRRNDVRERSHRYVVKWTRTRPPAADEQNPLVRLMEWGFIRENITGAIARWPTKIEAETMKTAFEQGNPTLTCEVLPEHAVRVMSRLSGLKVRE